MGGMMGGRMTDAEAKKQLKTLTRTDFLLQFVWKPPKPEELPKTEEEHKGQDQGGGRQDDRGREEQPGGDHAQGRGHPGGFAQEDRGADSKIQKALAVRERPDGAPGSGIPQPVRRSAGSSARRGAAAGSVT